MEMSLPTIIAMFFFGEWITALSTVSRILFSKPLYFAIGHLLDPFYACPFRLASSKLLGVYLFFVYRVGATEVSSLASDDLPFF
jgi:hypothetical protein